MRNSYVVASIVIEDIIENSMSKINKMQTISKNNIGTWCSGFLSGLLQSEAHINDAGFTKNLNQCPQVNSIFKYNSQPKITHSKSLSTKAQKSKTILSKQTMKIIPQPKMIQTNKQKEKDKQNNNRFMKLTINRIDNMTDDKNCTKQQVHFNSISNEKQNHNMNASFSQIRSKRSIRSAIDGKQNKKQQKQFIGGVVVDYHVGPQRKVKSKSHQVTAKAIYIADANIRPQRSKTVVSHHITFRKKDANTNKKEKTHSESRHRLNIMDRQLRLPKPITSNLKSKNSIHVYNLKKTRQFFPQITKDREVRFPRFNLRL